MRYEITALAPGYTGRIATVAFTDGRALVDDPPPGALEYFRRHGYTVAQLDDTGPPDNKPTGRSAARTRPRG